MKRLMRDVLVMVLGLIMTIPFSGVYSEDTYAVVNPFGIGESGVILNGHYVYCVDPDNPWPDKDTIQYHQTDASVIGAEEQTKIARALSAGYPLDMFGLSQRNSDSDQDRGTYTQWIVWAVLGSPTYQSYCKAAVNEDAYVKALYEYAFEGTIDGKAPSAADNEITASVGKLSKNTDGTWSGTLAFDAAQRASVTITSIPEGMTLKNGNAVLKANDTISSSDVLTVTVSSAEKSSQIDFSYIQTERANEELNLYSTNDKDGDKTYQRMIGYQFSEISASFSAIVKAESTTTDRPLTPATEEKTTTSENKKTHQPIEFAIPNTAVKG